ncbi:MAG: AMP-binding protein [Cytophagaceae bacterium]
MATKIWINQYPKGVNAEINPDKFKSVLDFYDDCIKKYGEAPAYVNMGKTLSFHEVDDLATNFASYIQNFTNLKPGDRIAIQMPNLLQYPIVMFGALKAGLVIVNTNPLYTEREMEHQFKDAGVKGIVILSNFASKLQAIQKNIGIETVIVSNIGDRLGGLKGAIVNFVVKFIKKMVPPYELQDAVKLNKALKMGATKPYTRPTIQSSEACFLQYTGGTTGVSKGAVLTNRNILANMEQISEWFKPVLRDGQETVITALPLYHIFALTANCLAMLKYGARNILITNPRDMKAFLKDLNTYEFTLITGVNTLFNGLLNQPDFHKIKFSRLKLAVGGGMAVQKAVAEKWEKVTGTRLAEGYGLTETSPVVTCNPVDGRIRIGSIGLPLPGTDLKIVTDEGLEAAVGERGEIYVKGPQVMAGYWNRPEDTAQVMDGEWLKTGDIGVMDEDGFFKIVDRKKEMILVSGFNVYPSEVEDVIALHPKVLEVGVKSIPDEKTTEAVKAFVVKKDESLTEAELKEHCKKMLTNYKVPKEIVFRTELPKSNVGKILRRLME